MFLIWSQRALAARSMRSMEVTGSFLMVKSSSFAICIAVRIFILAKLMKSFKLCVHAEKDILLRVIVFYSFEDCKQKANGWSISFFILCSTMMFMSLPHVLVLLELLEQQV